VHAVGRGDVDRLEILLLFEQFSKHAAVKIVAGCGEWTVIRDR